MKPRITRMGTDGITHAEARMRGGVATLAILQNLWSPNADRVEAALNRHQGNPRMQDRFIERLIFAGGRTGKVIQQFFPRWREWIWTDASLRCGKQASDKFPADVDHIHARIRAYQPEVVISFGNVAGDGVEEVMERMERLPAFLWIRAVHPTCRLEDREQLLRDANFEYLDFLREE